MIVLRKLQKLSRHDNSRFIGGAASIFLMRLSGAAIAFATQVLMARWMGAAELGVYVLAFSWLIMVSTVSAMGFPEAAIRFVGYGLARKDHGYIYGYIRRGRQFVLIAGVGMACLAALIGSTFDGLITPAAKLPFYVAMVAAPFFVMISLNTGIATAFSWFAYGFLPKNVLRPLLFLGAISGVWYINGQLNAVVAMQLQFFAIVLVAIFAILILQRKLRRTVTIADRSYESKLWIRTAAPLSVITFFNDYFPEFTVILIGIYLPSENIAIYNAAFRVALLIAFGLHAVDAFAAPQLARLYAEGDTQGLQRIIDRATKLRFWSALLGVLGMGFAGTWILGLFGEEFVAGFEVLMILASAQLLRAAAGPVTRLLSVSGHQNQCLYVFGSAAIVAVVLVHLLVPRFGITGAASAAFFTTLFWLVWLSYLVVYKVGIRLPILSTFMRSR